MKENSKRSIVLIIIAIAILVLIVGAATYAFFATGRDLDNGIVNANVGTAASMYSFSATSNGNIEMNIAFNEMSQANVSTNALKTDNATIDVSLASPSEGMKTVCTYDIVWVWDSDEDNRYTTPDVPLAYTHTDGKVYNYEFSSKVDTNEEKDLSKYSTNGSIVTLQKDVTIESTSTTATEKTHRIDTYIYNLPVDQQKLFDKSFRAHITIDNLSCNMENGSSSSGTTLAKYWNDNFEYGEYTHPNTPSTTYKSVAELKTAYEDDEYYPFSENSVYIKTTEEKHEACLHYNNKEFCLGANYWVNGDTDGSTTEAKLKSAMATSFGIEESSLICHSSSNYAYCNAGDFLCLAESSGIVSCSGSSIGCGVRGVGSATCEH